jgi:hypothetical protein
MASNLLKAGHDVVVCNRTAAEAAPLIALGAKAAASVAEACRCDAIITMLANDAAVESVTQGPAGVVANLAAGALHISSSTISVVLSQRLTEEHAKANQRFIAAPVFGRPEAAAARELFVVAGGEAMRPVCLSRKNSLFAGSDEGGANWACLAYFTDLLTRLVDGLAAETHRRIDAVVLGAAPTATLISRGAEGSRNIAYCSPA